MPKLTLVMIAAATLLALSVSPAHAGATCKIIPTFGPPPPGSGGGGGSQPVPEPATLAPLAAGAAAEIAAARRPVFTPAYARHQDITGLPTFTL
jgi:hypothetical protein